MATRILNVALRIALLTAAVASVVLFVDYGSSASPAFCGAGGGCARVRDSAFSHIGPVSLPAIGIGTFSGLLALAVWASRRRHRQMLALQTGVVAFGALVLIGLQAFWIRALCPWCLAVDSAAIISFGLAWAVQRRSASVHGPDEESVPLRVMWTAAAVTAMAVPFLWNYAAAANVVPIPKALAKFQVPGKVNVIMFTDFQCPHCERLHDAMEAARPRLGDRVNLVRMMYPLDFHSGAEPAALAYLCVAEELREAAADRFYKAETRALTSAGVVKMAEELGADPQAVSRCMADAQTRARIAHDQEIFRNADLSGVPTSFVGAELIRGADLVAFNSALDRAQGGDGGGSDVQWMFLFIALVVGGAAVVSIRSVIESDDEA